eukprot:TRINITY_DN460_c0_g1_i4.p4 TRINITY_DN460_c0_g1~~TRINITY_DN460_c0_g1_i4.p4  ORF type:complete len:111 (-),score=14.77 TRINITY_DN460_c0_g1_i4:297-629(-)
MGDGARVEHVACIVLRCSSLLTAHPTLFSRSSRPLLALFSPLLGSLHHVAACNPVGSLLPRLFLPVVSPQLTFSRSLLSSIFYSTLPPVCLPTSPVVILSSVLSLCLSSW